MAGTEGPGWMGGPQGQDGGKAPATTCNKDWEQTEKEKYCLTFLILGI